MPDTVIRVNRINGVIALITVLLLSLLFRYHASWLESQEAVDVQVDKLPYTIGEWKGKDTVGLDIRSQETLRLDRYVKRLYTNSEGEQILLYVGYWKKQSGDYQAAKHSPQLCLPSNGWYVERKPATEVSPETSTGVAPFSVKRLVGEIGDNAHLFYYWFFTGEQNYSDEWKALLTISFQSFLAGRSDGGIVEISTPLEGGEAREENIKKRSALVEDFLFHFYPALNKLIAERN